MSEKPRCSYKFALLLSLSLSTSSNNSHSSPSLPLQCSLRPCEIDSAPLVSRTHTEQLRKLERLPRRQLWSASRCCVSQAERLICGEVFALTNNRSTRCYVPHCITLFDMIPLEVSIFSIMSADCFCYWSHLCLWWITNAWSLKSQRLNWIKGNGASLLLFVSTVGGEIFHLMAL